MMDTADVVAISGLTGLLGTLAASEAADTASVEVRVASALTDAAWAEICAAAKHAPDDEARAVLSAILFNDYPGFTYDRARVAAAAKRARRMLKNFAAFEADYRAQFAPADNAILADPPIRIKPDLWCLEGLRRRTEAVLLVARTLQRANARRRNVQREMLYYWLCTMWREHFHAELTYRRRPEGGDPYGELISFMLAAMRQVMPEDALPDPETVRDAIDRYKKGRKKLLSYEKRNSGT